MTLEFLYDPLLFLSMSSASERSTWQWWSGGKDSALALRRLRSDPAWSVRGLITQVDRDSGRAVPHGVPEDLIRLQAAAVGLPHRSARFSWGGPRTDYELVLRREFHDLRRAGAEFVAFGELSSSASRARRSYQLAFTGLVPEFPLWGSDSGQHAEAVLEAGISAWVCAVDTTILPSTFVGRRYDADFLADLPAHVDPCGENAEFHTFVEWAPGWSRKVPVKPGRLIQRYGFTYVDLELATDVTIPVAAPPVDRQKSPEGNGKGDGDGCSDGGDGRGGESGADGDHAEGDLGATDPFEYFERLGRVRSYVDDHLEDGLSLAAVAVIAAMTPSSFSRYFRRRVGSSFRSWLTGRRLERAAQLLQESDMTVDQVGKIVGLRGGRTFRRAFQLQFGCCASQYRKDYLAEAGPKKRLNGPRRVAESRSRSTEEQ